jgi:S1-C subfamily serine protease
MYFYRNKNKLTRLLILFLSSMTISLLVGIQQSAIGVEDLLPRQKSLETTVEISRDTFSITHNDFPPSANGVIVEKNTYNQKRYTSSPGSTIPKYEYSVLTNRHVLPHIKSRYFIRISNSRYQVVAIYPTDIEVPGSPDLALIKFRSDRELEVLSLGYLSQVNPNQVIYIGGRVNSIFMFCKGSIEKVLSGEIKYSDKTEETIKGMSGSPILDAGGTLVGIHAGKKLVFLLILLDYFCKRKKNNMEPKKKTVNHVITLQVLNVRYLLL